jgi:hypothetical protein
MSDYTAPKTFTKDYLDFQDLNDMNSALEAAIASKVDDDGTFTGNLTGNVTGNVTGDVTGNVTGNVTGDVTGNADTATELAGATGGKWVEVVSGSVSINNGSNSRINLRDGGQYNLYMFSVYQSAVHDPITNKVILGYSGPTPAAGYAEACIVQGSSSTYKDYLFINNNMGQAITFYYKVWAWES